MLFKPMQNLSARFSKISKVTGLTRLKVFQQIMLIVIILVVFLCVQSLLNVRIINSMQQASHNIYVEGSYRSNQISRLKQDILKLQTAYLEEMMNAGSTASTFGVTSVERIITPIWLDEETKKEITAKLDSIKELAKNIPSKSDYELFRSDINEILLRVGMVEAKVSSAATENITSTDRFLIESRINGIIIVIISLVLAVFIGLIIANSISAPLKQIEAASKAMATGDLAHNIEAGGSPEILGVVNGLNQAIYGLRELVKNIDSQSEVLNQASKELQTASAETGKSSSVVARAVEEIAQGSSRQAEQIAQAANTIQSLSETVGVVSTDIESIAAASEKVAQEAKIGLKSTFDVRDEIQELYVSTKEIAEVINELSKTTDEINEITSVIHGVAEQTSLLALNAAIEAARAGEHGKGFAVVAHETGKLAEQSKQAADLIVDLIGKIKTRTDQAVTIVQKGMEMAESGKNFSAQTSETFEDIFKSLNENLTQIENVAQSARKMTDNNKLAIDAITEIAAISEESMASNEEVSATAEEQSASAQEVAALSENLNQIATSLHQAVSMFALEKKDEGSRAL